MLRPKDGSRRRLPRVSAKQADNRTLDRLCRDAVFLRDGNRCRRCGKTTHLQWCHIYSRRYLTLRWDPDNSLVLCAGCHLWQHHNPLDSSRWVEQAIGVRVAERLRLAMQYRGGKIDRNLIRVALENSAPPEREHGGAAAGGRYAQRPDEST